MQTIIGLENIRLGLFKCTAELKKLNNSVYEIKGTFKS